MASVTLYMDPLSQPSRSVLVFMLATGIPHEVKPISIMGGTNRSEEYLAINPQGTVPFIVDGDVRLSESAAIMAYLCNSRPDIPEHWYPRAPAARARVDRASFWHGASLRNNSVLVLTNRVLAGVLGQTPCEEVAQAGLPRLHRALREIEDVFLGEGGKYVGGDDVTTADLLLSEEIEMLTMLDLSPLPPNYAEFMADYPRVRAWLARLSQRCAPHYAAALQPLVAVKAKLAGAAAAADATN